MKICYLSDASSVHTIKWCEYFKNKGHQISVISLGDGEISGVKVYSLKEKGFRERSDLSKLKYIKKRKEIKDILNLEKPDIIHVHYATSYGILAALTKKHPYILSVWGADVYDFPKKGFFHKLFLKYNLKNADVIFSTSNAMKQETLKYTDKNIIVTPFGVNISEFKPMKVDRHSGFTVGTVKSFYPKYGINYLIKGFKLFKDEVKDENLKLLLGGAGSQEEELRNLVAELKLDKEVEFLGFLNKEGVIRAFNMMDVAVFPSTLDSESFGVAAVEAQACGVAAVVSNVGGLPEATSVGYSSLCCEKKDENSIANALIKLYRDENLLNDMKKNARDFVVKNYNIEDNFKNVEDIYKRLIIEGEYK